MSSWEDNDGDNWVTYGSAFSDDDTEEGRQRALHFGKRRPVPTTYEQRVLNEKGRPMRFHGAFTGGFSAGYFNSVGSKEGFKPRSFHSSRKDRIREPEERQMVQRPEDFMDDEDFGEFGIAPRRIRMAHTFDDTHVRDTLKAALGGQSVIPVSNELLKNLIIPSKGPLAERLLRRMGWRDPTTALDSDETSRQVDEDSSSAISRENLRHSGDLTESPQESAPCLFAKISFEAKTNTFGLGYSGLNLDVAMGRQLPGSRPIAPWDDLGDRHPEESSTALSRRQQAIQLQPGFNPQAGPARSGIRGQAFGVGALETEDGDIYAQDKLADYDWEIGAGLSSAEDEDEEDAELAELEAARTGRLSSSIKRPNKSASAQPDGKRQPQSAKTIDGWTAPTCSRAKHTSGGVSVTGLLHGFAPASDSQAHDRLMLAPPVVRLPPGYMPVFNPQCIRDPAKKPNPATELNHSDSQTNGTAVREPPHRRLDALSRAQILHDPTTDSVLDMINPVEQLRIKAAAAGLPVPKKTEMEDTRAGHANLSASDLTQSLKTDALLKPFKADAAKQARFDAFQVLVRRGFTDEVAYTRCSGGVDLSGEERERELSAFQAIIRTARSNTTSNRNASVPGSTGDACAQPSSEPRDTPLSTQLPAHKQQLVASLLASRFRSAGCMDISKELSESEEKALRAKVESLETMEPRDHAVATESYGALTRRRLEWHPDRILCKRVNVPHPYPDSTFVGCPEERRVHNPWRRRHHNRPGDRSHSKEFSLFDLLDVNRGTEEDTIASDSDEASMSPSQTRLDSQQSPAMDESLSQNAVSSQSQVAASKSVMPAGSLFSVLFETAASASKDSTRPPSALDGESSTTKIVEEVERDSISAGKPAVSSTEPRRLGPFMPSTTAPTSAMFTVDEDESRPSMDLFKSIFASDEELSESDNEANPTTHEQPVTERIESTITSAIPTGSSSLFAHLFEPTGDIDAPLSGIAQFTSADRQTNPPLTDSNRKSRTEPDPQFIYGPALPPTLVLEPEPSNPTDLSCSNLATGSQESKDQLEWVVGCSKTKNAKHHRHHRHHRKRLKQGDKRKTKRKHKSHHKATKRSRDTKVHKRSQPPSPTSSSSSLDSSDSDSSR